MASIKYFEEMFGRTCKDWNQENTSVTIAVTTLSKNQLFRFCEFFLLFLDLFWRKKGPSKIDKSKKKIDVGIINCLFIIPCQ